jgi:hypothetical protein
MTCSENGADGANGTIGSFACNAVNACNNNKGTIERGCCNYAGACNDNTGTISVGTEDCGEQVPSEAPSQSPSPTSKPEPTPMPTPEQTPEQTPEPNCMESREYCLDDAERQLNLCSDQDPELFCINTIFDGSFECLNKDDTDDILLANKIIRETHQDLCESAEECLEKTEKSLGKIRDESLKDGVNTSLFLLAIEQIEAAFNNIMVANATLCINKDKALCNELLNKASKEGKVLFRRVEANGDVKYEKHPEDKIVEKTADGFSVLYTCDSL